MSSYDQTVSMRLHTEFSQANSAIDSCIAKLRSLSDSLAAINQNINGLKSFKSVMNSLSKLNFGNLGTATQSIQTLATATTDLSTHLAGLKDTASSINSLKNALNGLGKVNVTTTRASILAISRAVQEASQNLNSTNTSKLTELISKYTELTKAVTEYNRQLEKAKKNTNSLNGSKIRSAMISAKRSIESTSKSLGVFGKTLSNLWTFGKWYAIYNQIRHFGRALLDILQKPIDFGETENYFSVAFKDMRAEAWKFGNDLSEAFGLALPNILQMQATFKNMIGSIGGLAEETTSMISEVVTKMTIDYASLYNVGIEDASKKFQSALSRQVRPIRSTSGYDITSNVLGGTAQELGITDRTIAKMSEMEKRLLVIITLQKQMDRSGALQDYARTIENPANQLKILTEQLSELGRAFGSMFTASIGKILPYVNGLVMALKEAVMHMAFLFGYEMPNTNGSTGTILDNYDDSLTDINDGLEDIGDATDSNYEKAKKWKNFLAGFDVAEVIPTPSEYEGSGSSGSGGIDATYVDPRILSALQDYDNLMYSIDMKAKGIKEKIQTIFSTIGQWVSDNIFQPIQTSWETYSEPIMSKLASIKETLAPIFESIVTSISSGTSGYVSGVANVVLSIVNTVLTVVESMASALSRAWNTGGKTFVDGLANLMGGVTDLATSLNDNFIQPLLAGLGVVFEPMGDLLGTILGFMGNIASKLGDFFKWLSKCKTLIKIIGSLITGLVLTSAWGHLMQAPGVLLPLLAKIASVIKGFAVGMFTKLATGLIVVNTALKSTAIVTAIGALGTTLTTAGAAASGLAAILMKVLGAALTFIATHPVVAVALAVAGLTLALVSLGEAQDDVGYKFEDLSESVQKQIKAIEDFDTSIDSFVSSYEDSVIDAVAEAETLEKALENIEKASEDGVISEDEMATTKTAVDKLNESLGETVVEIKDGTVAWKKDRQAIKNRIKALKESAIEEAKMQVFKDYVAERYKLQLEEVKVTREIADKNAEILDLEQKITDATNRKDWEAVEEYSLALEQATDDLEGLKDAQEMCNDKIDDMNTNIDNLDSILEESTKAIDGAKDSVDNLSNSVANAETDVKLNVSYAEPTSKQTEALFTSLKEKMKGLSLKAQVGVDTEAMKNTLKNFFNNNVFHMKGEIAIRMPGSSAGSPYDDTYITLRAGGGFPSVGEMFIARENGPELVGTIGGRSAVANNQQIVEGISSGVYQAMTSALSNQGGDLYLTIQNSDGSNTRKIIRDYNNYMKQTGGKGGFNV